MMNADMRSGSDVLGWQRSVFSSVLPFLGYTLLTIFGLTLLNTVLLEEEKEAKVSASEEKESKDSASEEDFEEIAEKAYASIIKSLPGSSNGFNKMDRSKQSKVLQKLAKDLKCAQGHDTFQDLKDAFESTSHENEISSKWTLFSKFEAEYGKVVCPHDEL